MAPTEINVPLPMFPYLTTWESEQNLAKQDVDLDDDDIIVVTRADSPGTIVHKGVPRVNPPPILPRLDLSALQKQSGYQDAPGLCSDRQCSDRQYDTQIYVKPPLTDRCDRSQLESLRWLTSSCLSARTPRQKTRSGWNSCTSTPGTTPRMPDKIDSYRFSKRNIVQRLVSREQKAYLECLKQEAKSLKQEGASKLTNQEGANKRTNQEGANKLTISFSVVRQTRFGEEVRILGNAASLGSWDPNRAVAMKWSDGHKWQATIEVELPSPESRESLEYKYVMMSQGQLQCWESCENRLIRQPQGGSLLIRADVWNGS
eukprot:gnl/MRDRNA2_/MRDRNA2_27074_c0_seq2.p1 gnl/MRDRNA2_/MRDRNA2_27074_c0~~gnl/MRDRNA2_/MRDRNA2_27074_c0_seq2.p1  ORF type:complete len:316 (+),score=50.68 gnl/MRDRNA2_/MRDRNA2_27074_c0_seq2:100-1047(+)